MPLRGTPLLMTSSTLRPRQLDLGTLNATQSVVSKALQSKVCEWEQAASDAAARGEYRSAQQYKEWAFAADLAFHTASMALGALFLETLDAIPIVEDTRTVQLPDLRRPEDRCMDALQVEVASHQLEGRRCWSGWG